MWRQLDSKHLDYILKQQSFEYISTTILYQAFKGNCTLKMQGVDKMEVVVNYVIIENMFLSYFFDGVFLSTNTNRTEKTVALSYNFQYQPAILITLPFLVYSIFLFVINSE